MPNTKSAKKHVRADEKNRIRNFSIKSSLKTKVKKAEDAFRTGTVEEAEEALREAVSTIDKARQKGVIKKNTASRKKSRLTKKFNKMQAA